MKYIKLESYYKQKGILKSTFHMWYLKRHTNYKQFMTMIDFHVFDFDLPISNMFGLIPQKKFSWLNQSHDTILEDHLLFLSKNIWKLYKIVFWLNMSLIFSRAFYFYFLGIYCENVETKNIFIRRKTYSGHNEFNFEYMNISNKLLF